MNYWKTTWSAVGVAVALVACGQPVDPGAKFAVQGLNDGQTVNGSIDVTVVVRDATPSAVEFVLDGDTTVRDDSAPYTFKATGLSNRLHKLVVRTVPDAAGYSTEIKFTSQGAPTVLTGVSCDGCGATLSGTVNLGVDLQGANPDRVVYTVTQGTGLNSTKEIYSADRAPFTYKLDTMAAGLNGAFTVNAQAYVLTDLETGDAAVVSKAARDFQATNEPPSPPQPGSFFDELNIPDASHWTLDADGGSDTYEFVGSTWGLPDVSQLGQPCTEGEPNCASVVKVHSVRDVQGSDSRLYRGLGRTLTDANSFEFSVIWRWLGRSSANEWAVGRVGLINTVNDVASDPSAFGDAPAPQPVDPVNNNINSVAFEIEAQDAYPVGFFAMVNVNRKDCQDTNDLECSRRATKRVPIDPDVTAYEAGHADAGVGRWMLVKCTYTAEDRVFQCVGRNDEQGKTLGATGRVVLGPNDHFSVDAFAIQASGRRTFGASPVLDWEVGRISFKVR